MKTAQLAILILILTALTFGQSNSWNGITPLHSTRAEVENLLGKPQNCDYGLCKYETAQETVVFTYLDFRCELGWNVPKDTVAGIFIKQKNLIGKSYRELNLDEKTFKILNVNDVLSTEWLKADEGISYHFDVQRILTGKSFHPRKADSNLRCDGFPPYAPEEGYYLGPHRPLYDPKDNSGNVFYRIIAGFDEVIHAGRSLKRHKAYAVVYFDNKLSLKEYRNRVKRIKDFLINKRRYPPNEITIIEGGLRETSDVEFYLRAEGEKPPTPSPTFPSPQFMRKQ